MEQFTPNHLIYYLLIDTLLCSLPLIVVGAKEKGMYISTSGYIVFRMSVQEARTTTIMIALVVIGEGKGGWLVSFQCQRKFTLGDTRVSTEIPIHATQSLTESKLRV